MTRKQLEFEDKLGNKCVIQLPEPILENVIRFGVVFTKDGTYNSPMVVNKMQAKQLAAFLLYFIMFDDISLDENDYIELIKFINSIESLNTFCINNNEVLKAETVEGIEYE